MIEVKICGINSSEAARSAAKSGADFAGFVFYADSPRVVTPEQAAAIAGSLPPHVKKVALFVDADDATIANVLSKLRFNMLQLHGSETPQRVADIKERFGLPVMKAFKIASASDLRMAKQYKAPDRLLFDAKPPEGARPGGNALAFDWELLRGFTSDKPWMLSGGLTPENVGEAIRITGAKGVDVSSGVEDRPGHKDPLLIARFIAAARAKK